MDAELKAKWVTALRSGKYAQAREQLRAPRSHGEQCGFCCLGVLLDVDGFGQWDASSYVYENDGESRVLDGDLGNLGTAYGLADHEGILISMNDGKDGKAPHSFAEIADYIEAHIPADPEALERQS